MITVSYEEFKHMIEVQVETTIKNRNYQKDWRISMARAVHNGWDFVKIGNSYQYKESGVIAEILILEDTSDETKYEFKVKVLKSNFKAIPKQFTIYHTKTENGYYNDMIQIYEEDEYYFPNGYPFIFEE